MRKGGVEEVKVSRRIAEILRQVEDIVGEEGVVRSLLGGDQHDVALKLLALIKLVRSFSFLVIVTIIHQAAVNILYQDKP